MSTRVLYLGLAGGVLEFLWNVAVSPLWVNLFDFCGTWGGC